MKTAKVFRHGNSQAVRLPKEFRFDTSGITLSEVHYGLARHLKAVLVTNNEREFRRVPGLAVQNWLKP